MNIREAAERGIERLVRPKWVSGYMRVYIHDGLSGPWVTFWDGPSQIASGLDYPQVALSLFADEDFVEYTGEIDPNDTAGWPKVDYAAQRSASP